MATAAWLSSTGSDDEMPPLPYHARESCLRFCSNNSLLSEHPNHCPVPALPEGIGVYGHLFSEPVISAPRHSTCNLSDNPVDFALSKTTPVAKISPISIFDLVGLDHNQYGDIGAVRPRRTLQQPVEPLANEACTDHSSFLRPASPAGVRRCGPLC